MADPRKKLKTNVDGDFFVDSTCINCDTCRQLAPGVFGEAAGHSFVEWQPTDPSTRRKATQALLACPTGSIGNTGDNQAKEVMQDFPLLVDDSIYYCGFNSPKSYGGNSYLIRKPGGNWLIDSPKFLPHLVQKFHAMGGLSYIFLTHRDDVAEAAAYAKEFGAQRIIHKDDVSAEPASEIVIEGQADTRFGDDMVIITTPGHTAGHCVLLYKNKYLFTGDHLAWDRDIEALVAWPEVCWYDWEQQKNSLRKLALYEFSWILPGHGQGVAVTAEAMKSELNILLEWLK